MTVTPEAAVGDAAGERRRRASRAQRLAFVLDTTVAGRVWDILDALVASVHCVLYVVNTFYVAPAAQGYAVQWSRYKNAVPLPLPCRVLEAVIAAAILCNLALKIFVSCARWRAALSPYVLLSAVSAVPPILAAVLCQVAPFAGETLNSYFSAGPLVYLYPFRWARLHLLVTILLAPATKSPLSRVLTPVQRKSMIFAGAILFTMFTVAAFVHITAYKLAANEQPNSLSQNSFLEVVFFVIVSSFPGVTSTFPTDNWLTRLLLIYVVLAAAFYVPKNLSELLEMLRTRSKYRRSYRPNGAHTAHVVVCNAHSDSAMQSFLGEIFCREHAGVESLSAVLVGVDEPSEALSEVLADPAFSSRTTYIRGPTASFRVLRKARAGGARAVFIMTPGNTSSQNADGDEADTRLDAQSAMRALAVRRYNSDVPIFVEVRAPRNVSVFHEFGAHTMCVEELRLGILGLATRVPGFACIASLLTTTLMDTDWNHLTSRMRAQKRTRAFRDYVKGTTHEIHCAPTPAHLIGLRFVDAAIKVNLSSNGTVLLGVVSVLEDSKACVVLAPFDYVLKGTEEHLIFIACDDTALLQTAPPDEETPVSPPESNSTMLLLQHHRRFNHENVEEQDTDCDSDEEEEECGKETKTTTLHQNVHCPDQACNTESVARKNSLANECARGVAHLTPAPNQKTNSTTRAHVACESDAADADAYADQFSGHVIVVDPSSQSLPRNLNVLLTTLCRPTIDSVEEWFVPVPALANTSAWSRQSLSSFPSIDAVQDKSNSSSTQAATSPSSTASTAAKAKAAEVLVVLLAPVCPNMDAVSAHLRRKVRFVQGSAMSRKSLVRAGLLSARQLLILSSSASQQRTADAPAIFCALMAEQACRDHGINPCFILVEFVHRSNFRYIGPASESDPSSITETLESLSCLRKIRRGSAAEAKKLESMASPAFMSGNAFSRSMLESLLAQSYYSPFMLEAYRQLIFGSVAPDASVCGVKHAVSTVQQMPVPPSYVGQRYNVMFEALASGAFFNEADKSGSTHVSALAMALYRRYPRAKGRVTIIAPLPWQRVRSTDYIIALVRRTKPTGTSNTAV